MEPNEQDAKHSFLLKLFLLGFVLAFFGVILLVVTAWLRGDATVSGAVIIIIGFIPIVVGSGPYALLTIVIAALLTSLAFLILVWMRKKLTKG
jgi:uncharacterized membrane protein